MCRRGWCIRRPRSSCACWRHTRRSRCTRFRSPGSPTCTCMRRRRGAAAASGTPSTRRRLGRSTRCRSSRIGHSPCRWRRWRGGRRRSRCCPIDRARRRGRMCSLRRWVRCTRRRATSSSGKAHRRRGSGATRTTRRTSSPTCMGSCRFRCKRRSRWQLRPDRSHRCFRRKGTRASWWGRCRRRTRPRSCCPRGRNGRGWWGSSRCNWTSSASMRRTTRRRLHRSTIHREDTDPSDRPRHNPRRRARRRGGMTCTWRWCPSNLRMTTHKPGTSRRRRHTFRLGMQRHRSHRRRRAYQTRGRSSGRRWRRCPST